MEESLNQGVKKEKVKEEVRDPLDEDWEPKTPKARPGWSLESIKAETGKGNRKGSVTLETAHPEKPTPSGFRA